MMAIVAVAVWLGVAGLVYGDSLHSRAPVTPFDALLWPWHLVREFVRRP